MKFRQALDSDLPGEYAVFAAAQEELRNRRGVPRLAPAFDPSDMWAQVHRHLLARDGGRAFVAEQDGRIAGYTAALVRGTAGSCPRCSSIRHSRAGASGSGCSTWPGTGCTGAGSP